VKKLLLRLLGSTILGTCLWWTTGTIQDLQLVSLVHWPLLLPELVLEGVPAVLAGAAAAALLLNRRSAPTLLLLLAVTVGHAGAIGLVAPEIQLRYRETVEQAETAWIPADDHR
jgi:hypothetical protein